VPLVVDPRGFDPFRLPKEIAFNAAGIAVLAILAVAAILGRIHCADFPPFAWYYVIVAGWTAITVATATEHTLALHAALAIFGGMAFIATISAEPLRTVNSVFVLLVPAVLNGGLYVLQELRIWNPAISTKEFIAQMAASGKDWREEIHSTSTAFLGNPTDVAAFLIPTVIAFASLAVADRKRRPIFLAIAVVFAILMVSTRILTAVFAMIAMLFVLATLITRKSTLIALAVGICGGAFLFLYPPLRTKIHDTANDIRARRYGHILSSRLPAFLAAWEMIADHKLIGIGPGCFSYQYFDYKLKAEGRHAWMLDSEARSINFAEAHNDHLQVAAEMGVPGYLLFLTGLALLASGSFRRAAPADPDVRTEFSRLCSLPLAVGFAIFAAAQFPLRLPAAMIGFLFLAGLAIAWRKPLVTD